MTSQQHPRTYFETSQPAATVDFIHPAEGEDVLVVGTTSGVLEIFGLRSLSRICKIEAFDSPICWIGSIEPSRFVVTARASMRKCFIKIYEFKERTATLTWSNEERALDDLSSNTFCKGDVLQNRMAASEEEVGLVCVPWNDTEIAIYEILEKNLSLVRKVRRENAEEAGNLMCLKLGRLTGGSPVLMAGFEDSSICIWFVNDRDVEVLKVFDFKDSGRNFSPFSLAFDSKNQKGLIGGSDNTLILFELGENEEGKPRIIHSFAEEEESSAFSSVSIRNWSEKEIVACGSWDSSVKLYSWKNPKKLKPLGALKFHDKTVEDVVFARKKIRFSANGDRSQSSSFLLAVASNDAKVSIWDLYS